jgi:peptide/nickel transport system permease protein
MTIDYLLKRVGLLLVVIWLAVSINFVIPRLTPGDPIEQKLSQLASSSSGQMGDVNAIAQAYRERFGLDQPLWRQYINYWISVIRLDFGYSLANFPERVQDAILSALPWTVGLLGVCTLISFGLGTMLGGVLAWPRSPKLLAAVVPPIMVLSAMPYFLLGIVMIFLFAISWRLFPPAGGYPFSSSLQLDLETVRGILYHATLPALTIILASMGDWALKMRAMMTSVLGEDYAAAAEAKGLRDRTLFFWYGMRTSLLPQFTSLALALGKIVSGAILVEAIFAYPGLGMKLYQAIGQKDYFVIQGIVLLLTVTLCLAMFLLDLLYPLIDPRIRYRRG